MFIDYLSKKKSFVDLLNLDYKVIKNSNQEGNCLFFWSLFSHIDKSIIICLPNLYTAQRYYDILSFFLKDDVLFFPADELIINEMLISSDEFKFERLETIISSFSKDKKIIVTHTAGIIKKLFNKETYLNHLVLFEKNKTYDLDKLKEKFIELGYKRVFTVKKYGEFSLRGDVLDFYSFYNEPIRLDFFGDTLEEIKTFSVETQLKTGYLDNVMLYPNTELIYSNLDLESFKVSFSKFINNLEEDKTRYIQDLDKLETRDSLNVLNRYIEFFDKEKKSIIDFFDAEVFLVDLNRIESVYQKTINDLDEYCSRNNCYSLFELKYFFSLDSILEKNKNYKVIEGLTHYESSNYISFRTRDITKYENNIKLFVEDCEKRYLDEYVILAYKNDTKIEILREYFRNYDILLKEVENYNFSKGVINLIKEDLISVELINENIFLVSESDVFKESGYIKTRYRSLKQEGAKISSIDELKIGDYIVHFDHGIGRYMGIKTLKNMDIIRDYIYLKYADDGALYIPIEQFNRLRKYVGSEAGTPKLTKLGTKQWENSKKRVKEKINDMSDKLIELYAKRETAQGFVFSKDTEEQKIFDEQFEFEETKDQLKIIEEVKKDMESTKPMDRLICGDVGYGKTEIALRAAFKAIMDGKQVAYLAPTTVLARQHYNTFMSRFSNFGACIKIFTRFTSLKEEKEILNDLKTGKIDCLIGTHRILSDDIVFKDLGLFIIDEEQRFGVKHKEKIKEIKINVDAITLTATPIPRTLQMSIMGIKDLSMLETPPKNRYPVQTYVLERNKTIIKEAIERELARSGQVFYLYNHVQDIEEETLKIKELVKDARVCFAHGKMDKGKLERIIESFVNHEYDVLVATTIIETGIDIPNTNTLIIHDADLLGLSQLYQLRGRVGRSDRIAYAYLMYDSKKRLTETAYKRLEVIKEFTELGSGFKIAMRDLSIRGAGDILGSDQSGFIDSIGLDLYLKILDETIKEKKGIVTDNKEKRELGKVLFNRHISEDLIDNDTVRIEMHQKIDSIKSTKEMDKLKEEFIDRFGKIEDEIVLYMEEKLFKNILEEIEVKKVIYSSFEAVIYLSNDYSKKIDPSKMFMVATNISRNINFEYRDNSFLVKFHMVRSENWLLDAIKFFEELNKSV